ncbi:MAG: aminotransferase class I/II-fold pyridoxal phosphate-dependent enzyme, partial [Planctomycetota bacterium]
MTSTRSTAQTLSPAARLKGIRAYSPPPFDHAIDLKLDANEGELPAGLLDRLTQQLTESTARLYPSTHRLQHALAQRHACTPDRIVITNGGDDAINRICQAVLEPGCSAVLHTPTFEMIPTSARLAGGAVTPVPWLGGPFPTDDFVRTINDTTALVALVSPNNPTGDTVPIEAVSRIATAAADANAILLFDAAYAEFADHDPTPELAEHPNIVIVRTFSKAFGLAGLRVGYAIAQDPVTQWLR